MTDRIVIPLPGVGTLVLTQEEFEEGLRRGRTLQKPPEASEAHPGRGLFSLKELCARNPDLLPPNRVRWALRHRATNGLVECGAVFEGRGGQLIFHEPTMINWLLGLTGRTKR